MAADAAIGLAALRDLADAAHARVLAKLPAAKRRAITGDA